MRKKKEDHTGFRNNNLFCFHCGTSQVMPLPMQVGLAADFMKLFVKHHKNCAKVWKEPSPKETEGMATVAEKMKWWKDKGEHGTSSETLFGILGGDLGWMIPKYKYEHPHDPDDFRRCWLLLEAIPEWKTQLDRMKPISDQWNVLVDNWDKLTELLIEGMKIDNGEEMYDFMKKIGIE